LEKTSKIIKSNHPPNTTIPTKSYPEVIQPASQVIKLSLHINLIVKRIFYRICFTVLLFTLFKNF